MPLFSSKLVRAVGQALPAAALLIALMTIPVAALDISADTPSGTTPTISQGDSVFVHGTATGHPVNGLQVWLIGTNYARVTNVPVNNDNTYEYEVTKAETQNMAGGQYFVLIQHPMMNGEFDITYNAGTGEVINEQLGAGGSAIFRLTGPGSLQGPAGAAALMRAVGSQNIDDTFTSVSFSINPANALIDPIPDHAVGDRFTITGNTNLAVGDELMVEISSESFRPTNKMQPSGFSGAGGTVRVQKGTDGLNKWSFDVDASTFAPDEYTITVSGILQDVKGSSRFRITEGGGATTYSATTQPVTSSVPTSSVTAGGTFHPVTTKTPLGSATLLAGLVAGLVLWCRLKQE
jgi:hypothetical protein